MSASLFNLHVVMLVHYYCGRHDKALSCRVVRMLVWVMLPRVWLGLVPA